MIAVFVNMGTVLLGSLIGILCRNKIKQAYIDIVISALALVTIVIGVGSAVGSNDTLCLIICIVIGTVLGTLMRIDEGIDGAGDFIKNKVLRGKNLGGRFTEGFVPPTADISATTSAPRYGDITPASRVSPPWNTRMNNAEKVTPRPMAAPNIIDETKSSALFAKIIS